MLTKDDKKFIVDSITGTIAKNNDILVKEMLDLFTVTNERIDKTNQKVDNVKYELSEKIDDINEKIDDTNERIDKVLDMLRTDDESINVLEKRVEKIEEKVFVTTTSS